MVKVGITGLIGAGKSYLGKMLRERGFLVLDADCKIHELYRDSKTLRQELAHLLGESCLTPTGVNRTLVADRIFSDPETREKLEQIVYPHLNFAVKNFFEENDTRTEKFRFVEAALFSRAPEIVKMLDEIWIVEAPEKVRLCRLVSRGLTETDALRRINDQRGICAPGLFPGKRILTLVNDGDISSLNMQLDALLGGLH